MREQRGPEYGDQRNMVEFWKRARPHREPLGQRWFLPLIAVSVCLCIPWYFAAGHTGRILHGLPVWVWISLGSAFGVAILTATAALFFWRNEKDGD